MNNLITLWFTSDWYTTPKPTHWREKRLFRFDCYWPFVSMSHLPNKHIFNSVISVLGWISFICVVELTERVWQMSCNGPTTTTPCYRSLWQMYFKCKYVLFSNHEALIYTNTWGRLVYFICLTKPLDDPHIVIVPCSGETPLGSTNFPDIRNYNREA